MGQSYSSSIGSQKGVQNLEGLTAGELTVFLSERSEDSCQGKLEKDQMMSLPSGGGHILPINLRPVDVDC